MKKSIGIFTDAAGDGLIRGCWKVTNNLINGLNKLGIPYSINKPGELNGCIVGDCISDNLPQNTLIGPEIMVLPSEDPSLWNKWKNWTQPSQWVIDYMQTFNETTGCNMYVWPVGIDTEKFIPIGNGRKHFDCFVYYKNVTQQTPIQKLQRIQDVLNKKGISHAVITYGQYDEDGFRRLMKKCKFGIFLTGTESQGIAYMEALSSGIPLIIIEEKVFAYSNYSFSNANVSAAPYFDDRCGEKIDINDFDLKIGSFIQKLKFFNPREYIIENHTLEKGAQKYYDILLKINDLV